MNPNPGFNPNNVPLRPPMSVGAIPGMYPPAAGRFPFASQSAPVGAYPGQPSAITPGIVGAAPTDQAEANVVPAAGHELEMEEGGHVIDEKEDLAKQRREKDYSGEWGKQVYCQRHFNSFLPLLIIFTICGRFPFWWKRQADGTYQFKFKAIRFMTVYFIGVTFALIAVLLSGLGNSLHIVLNPNVAEDTSWQFEKSEFYPMQREIEDVLITRYSIPLIYIYSSLIHGLVSTFLMLRKRNYIAHYYTFWSRAIYTMHMDVSIGGRAFSVKVMVAVIVAITSFILLISHGIGPTSIGLPTMFGDLTFRTMHLKERWLETDTPTRRSVQLWGGFLLVFMFVGSKSTILAFIYHCKLLQTAFAYWNGRVYAAVLRGGEFAQTEEGRTTYKLLFKDHCILMDLMEGLDQVFAFSLESYFGCQIFSLFFELYFCIRTAKQGENRGEAAYPEGKQNAFYIRPYDWAPGLLMLSLSISLMYTVAKSAASVAEEAMAGLEVLRRRTMLGRKTDDELYFMVSMFSSYTAYKKLQISGGGYSYMNKDFLIGLVSAVLSYFIILYQFQPVMDEAFSASGPNRTDRKRIGEFLIGLEGLPDLHYETTTPNQSEIWRPFKE